MVKIKKKEKNHQIIFYVFLSVLIKIRTQNISSDDNIEEIPVPIPNTEVKLYSAEDTCGVPCWKNRSLPPFIYSSLAQLVERSAVNR